jgi:hypothetical protein
MDVLVTQQDDTINAIETSATQVQKDTEAGYVIARSPNPRLIGITASDRPRKLWNMPDQLAESVGSVFSYSSPPWPLPGLQLESLWEINISIRCPFTVRTLDCSRRHYDLLDFYDFFCLYLSAASGSVSRPRILPNSFTHSHSHESCSSTSVFFLLLLLLSRNF